MSGKQLTLIADLEEVPGPPTEQMPEYSIRETLPTDEGALAELYLETYLGQYVEDLEGAREELRRTFEGEYGRLDLEASPIALHSGRAAASVLTVTEAPWPDTPPGPFIIELMVRPAHRRKGLAARLIQTAACQLASCGKKTVALRVMSDNEAALRLYRRLGFRECG